jgi:hypothetical protein
MVGISPEATVWEFKKCCVTSAVEYLICCGMTVKRLEVIADSVRKLKAPVAKVDTLRTLYVERLTPVGKSR